MLNNRISSKLNAKDVELYNKRTDYILSKTPKKAKAPKAAVEKKA